MTDTDRMHWAVLGKAQRDFTLAGVALAQMQGWVERLSACGIRAHKMLPDVLALPLPGQCSAALARSLADPGEWAEHVAARCLAGLHSVADAGLVSALRRGNSGGLGSGAH